MSCLAVAAKQCDHESEGTADAGTRVTLDIGRLVGDGTVLGVVLTGALSVASRPVTFSS
jgi:hypothetical protein